MCLPLRALVWGWVRGAGEGVRSMESRNGQRSTTIGASTTTGSDADPCHHLEAMAEVPMHT